MNKKKQGRLPVFFAMCIGILMMCCGCSRGSAFRFDTVFGDEAAQSSFGASASAEADGDAPKADPDVEQDSGAAEDLSEPDRKFVNGGEQSGERSESDGNAGATETEPETIWVYVCGAVRVPGVYELPAEGRVYQALEAAGGAEPDAELRSLNQAAVLTDGEQITVYTVQEVTEAGTLPGPGSDAQNGGEEKNSGKVNLNTAGREELMTLSGIGEARAQAILSYREAHGPFTTIEEIMNIEGIKEKAFSKIKDEIEV